MVVDIGFYQNDPFCSCDGIIGAFIRDASEPVIIVLRDSNNNIVQGPVTLSNAATVNSISNFTFRNVCSGTYRVCYTPVAGGAEACSDPIVLANPVADHAHFVITHTASDCTCNGTVTLANNSTIPVYGFLIRANDFIFEIDGDDTESAASLFHFHLPAGDSQTVDNLCPGEYAILLDDDNDHDLNDLRCRRNFIIGLSEPTINIDILKDPCEGESDGKIVVTAHGGFPFLDANNVVLGYLYDDGLGNFSASPALSRTLTNVSAGCHTYSVKNANGCVTTHECHIEADGNCPDLDFNEVVVDTCPCQNTGKVTLTGVNGTAPYQYSRDNVTYSTNNVFSDLGAGTYVFYVKDADGEVHAQKITVGTKPGPVVTSINVTPELENCQGEPVSLGSITVTASGGNCKLTYLLRKRSCAKFVPCQTCVQQKNLSNFNAYHSNVITGLEAGEYELVVTDSHCCQTEVEHIIVPLERQKCACPAPTPTPAPVPTPAPTPTPERKCCGGDCCKHKDHEHKCEKCQKEDDDNKGRRKDRKNDDRRNWDKNNQRRNWDRKDDQDGEPLVKCDKCDKCGPKDGKRAWIVLSVLFVGFLFIFIAWFISKSRHHHHREEV